MNYDGKPNINITLEEEAVTLTSVEAGDTSTGRSLLKVFPPKGKYVEFLKIR